MLTEKDTGRGYTTKSAWQKYATPFTVKPDHIPMIYAMQYQGDPDDEIFLNAANVLLEEFDCKLYPSRINNWLEVFDLIHRRLKQFLMPFSWIVYHPWFGLHFFNDSFLKQHFRAVTLKNNWRSPVEPHKSVTIPEGVGQKTWLDGKTILYPSSGAGSASFQRFNDDGTPDTRRYIKSECTSVPLLPAAVMNHVISSMNELETLAEIWGYDLPHEDYDDDIKIRQLADRLS